MDPLTTPGRNMGRRTSGRRNFFDDEVEQAEIARVAEEKEKSIVALQHEEVELDRDVAENRDLLIERGRTWVAKYVDDVRPNIIEHVAIETDDLEQDLTAVKLMFDRAALDENTPAEKAISETTSAKGLREDHLLVAHVNGIPGSLDSIFRDYELSVSLCRLPSYRNYYMKISKLLDAADVDGKLKTFSLVSYGQNHLSIRLISGFLSVCLRHKDFKLREYLLSFKNLFVYYKDLIKDESLTKFQDLENDKYDPDYSYPSWARKNYYYVKNTVKKIVIYDTELFYPMEWLQDHDKENIVIRDPKHFIGYTGSKYLKISGRSYTWKQQIGYMHDRCKVLDNDAFVLHHILLFFMKNNRLKVSFKI